MMLEPSLEIRLVPGRSRPRVGEACINQLRGGPETLLQWLETQLGLPVTDAPLSSRITELAAALDDAGQSCFTASLQTDRWATATELLARRDELLLAGWDPESAEPIRLPPLVADLARATAGRVSTFPGPAERLARITAALDAGQTLPPHRVALHDKPEAWPAAWRPVLNRLQLEQAPTVQPRAPAGSALRFAQQAVRGGETNTVRHDKSFRYAHTRSQSAAIEFVAATLAESPDKLAGTVICCEDDGLALRLDACLNRSGLPTMGVSASSQAHPVLQALPLSLALCWEPVDPQVLLDFLALPSGPIPRRAASRLAAALARQPGLGSIAWVETLEAVCDPEYDPAGKLRKRIDAWLGGERVPRGSPIPSRLVRQRCGMVAQWATGRAAWLAEQEAANETLAEAFRVAGGQAALLGELAECQGTTLSGPQLARLTEEAMAGGVAATQFVEAESGPTWVRSLAEIDAPCERLIWLGLGTDDAPACKWSTVQLRQLRGAGIDLDDGSRALAARRSAEARGFSQVGESFLAVLLPQDLEKRWHPIWLAARGLLRGDDLDQPPVVEELIAADRTDRLAPFSFRTSVVDVQPPQPARTAWQLPTGLLRDRDSVSASELQDRLGCPLKWTFRYQAKLYPSPIAELPSSFLLKGNLCHSILEQVFGDRRELPSVDEAVDEVLRAFDERLPLDAAPLAQPDQYLECQKLRGELEHATRVLVRTLTSGGYRLVGLETELTGQAFGKQLRGWIDCLVQRDGEEAIIDFKYGGRSKYTRLIEEGKAVQLATYAYARSGETGRFPAVAYLILSDGLFLTPSGSPVAGDGQRSVTDGPSIAQVWQDFSAALQRADGWLRGETAIPARPLQPPEQWPAGSDLVLEADLKDGELPGVCRYCDYGQLCGMRGTD